MNYPRKIKYNKELTDEDILDLLVSLFVGDNPPSENYYNNKKPEDYPTSTMLLRDYFKHFSFSRNNPDAAWNTLMLKLFGKEANSATVKHPERPLPKVTELPQQAKLYDLEGPNYWGLNLIPKDVSYRRKKKSNGDVVLVTRTSYMIR